MSILAGILLCVAIVQFIIICWLVINFNRIGKLAELVGLLESSSKQTIKLRGSRREIEFVNYSGQVKDFATGITASYDTYNDIVKAKLEAIKKLEDKLVAHAIDHAPHLNESLPHRQQFKSIVEAVSYHETAQ